MRLVCKAGWDYRLSSMNAEGRSRRSTRIQSTTADKAYILFALQSIHEARDGGCGRMASPCCFAAGAAARPQSQFYQAHAAAATVGSSHMGPHLPAATAGSRGRPAMLLPLFVTLLPRSTAGAMSAGRSFHPGYTAALGRRLLPSRIQALRWKRNLNVVFAVCCQAAA